jgi:hypothetical protein
MFVAAIVIWIGVAMLVPQYPFVKQDIATAVCLLVFSCFLALVTGGIVSVIIFVFCLPCSYCIDECIEYV